MADEQPQVGALVENAYREHMAGRLEKARRLYVNALRQDPGNARALGLAGALALQVGDARAAARLLERAVSIAPQDADSWNNLGAARVYLDDRDGAMAAYRRAVAADPRQFDARNNLGSLLLTVGDPRAAVPILKEALKLRPEDAGCRRTYASALRVAGDPWRAGRELAECRADVDDHPGAEMAWRRSLGLCPGDTTALAGLAAVLRGQERYGEAVEVLDKALALAPDNTELWLRKGNVLLAFERFAEAGEAFAKAIETSPGHVSARLNLGIVRLKQGRLDEAAQWFDELADEYPSAARIRYYQALTALTGGDTERALSGFESSLSDDPLHINSLWYRYHCLRELGREDEAAVVMDPSRDVTTFRPLEGMSAQEHREYLESLTSFVIDYPQQWWEPAGSTTRGGHQTPSLPLHEPELMQRFEAMVRKAVESYVAALPEGHVLRTHWPPAVRLSVWGTMLRRGGHQKPHIHPAGVLSGVFYTRLPEVTEAEPNAGWIEFGGTPYGTPTSYEPSTTRVKPEPGLLVVFPSYLPHSTVPFDSDTLRVSIAFDVMPVR